jgi:DNA-nicking Smr family endonuclease
MKRSSRPPVIIDPPRRRHRALSDDERVLWDSVAKQVKPLRKKRVAKPELTDEAPALVKVAAPKKLSSSAPAIPAILKPAKPTPPPAPPLAPFGRRERSQLSRGRKEIDARIDLHGMTQTRAHSALSAFLHRASYDGMTFVLVITGKGRTTGPESERGILRRQVPLWLGLPEFRSLVVGYEEASIGHGGTGALYVRIRRARS